jgi:hypothetical protein
MELEEGTTATEGVFARNAFACTVSPAGDGGDNGELVSGGDGRCFFGGKVTKILVVEINVDEGAKLALVVEELLLKLGVLGGEVGEDFGDSIAGNSDRLSSCCKGTERRWDVNVHA